MNSDQTTKYIDIHFNDLVDSKIKAFEQSVIKNYNFEKTYQFKNCILQKHFINNAIEEFNNKLALESKNFRVDFDDDVLNHFLKMDCDYFKKQGCISDDEEIILKNAN